MAQQSIEMQRQSSSLREDGHSDEQRPLNRLTSAEERAERCRVRAIFNELDTNNVGYLQINELKQLIRQNLCGQVPKGVARQILELNDINGDGVLDFEEFYLMSRKNQWLFKKYLVNYCKLIVPSPKREGEDQLVEGLQAFSTGPMDRIRALRAISVDETDGAYERSMTFCPPPLTMILFSIVEIITFLYDIVYFQEYYPENDRKIGESTNGPAATLFIYNPYKRYQAWRFVSYMFVHVGIMHIMMNLIIQIFLGVALELVHSWWRVTLVYVAGVAAGSMGTSITSPTIFLAGASGGVYALLTAHIATIIMNWSEMDYAIVQLFVYLIFCTTDLGLSIYHHLTDAHDKVGYVAHLSGATAGLLVGIGVLRNLKVRPWERKLWWCAVTLYLSLMFTGISLHIFYPQHFPKQHFNDEFL